MNNQATSLKRDIIVAIAVVVIGVGGGLGMTHLYDNMGSYIDQAVVKQTPPASQPIVAKK